MSDNNEFENLPVNQGIDIYINYLIASRDGDVKTINRLFKQHPDMFQPETLDLAKDMMKRIAKLNNDKNLMNLLEQVTNK